MESAARRGLRAEAAFLKWERALFFSFPPFYAAAAAKMVWEEEEKGGEENYCVNILK